MKKLLFTLFAMLMTVVVYAGGIKVSQGKTDYAKKEATMTVVFDWTHARWDNKQSAQEHLGKSFQEYVEKGQKAFVDGYNNAGKKVKIVENASSAAYEMTVAFTNFDYFFSAMSFVPGHKHKVWADVTVTDKATGNVVCKYTVDEFTGKRDFSIIDSFTEMLGALGENLAKKK